MFSYFKRVFTTGILASLVLAGPGFFPAQKGPITALGADRKDVMSPYRAVETYGDEDWEWTSEEMKNAKPYPMPVVSSGAKRRDVPPDFPSETEPFSCPADPGDQEDRPPEVPVEYSHERSDAALLLQYEYPPPFTSFPNFVRYRKFPYRTVGKLFFRQYDTSYVCSASSIGNFAIMTAGHCVHAGNGDLENGWSMDMVFVPAYRDGEGYYGQWKVVPGKTKALNGWITEGDLRYDLGGAILYRRNRKKISRVVGSLGFTSGRGDNQHWFSVGYPAMYPYNGMKMQICAASFAYYDSSIGMPSPRAMGCDMTAGSSGGPWILSFGGENLLNGVNSYRRCADVQCLDPYDKEMFSPPFEDAALGLYQDLVNDCPKCP